MTELQTPAPTQTMPPTRLAPRKPSRKKLIRRVIAIVVAAAILGGIHIRHVVPGVPQGGQPGGHLL